MSGSGGSGGGGSTSDVVPCDRLIFRTHLTSVKQNTLQKVKEDDLLVVEQESAQSTVILAKTEAGEAVGAVTSGKHAQLLRCLKTGVQFVAYVLVIEEGDCEVEIRPRG